MNGLRNYSLVCVACAGSVLMLPAGAHAQSAAVESSSLSWLQVNVFAGANRTWLGYVTSSPAPMSPSGTAVPIAPATGPTVTPASERGIDKSYRWDFAASSGTYDPSTGAGSIQFDGGLLFSSAPPPAGHGFTVSIDDPKVELNGLTGSLSGSGTYTGGTQQVPQILPYTTQPVYNLDLSSSEVVLRADGSREISGIVPTLAVTGLPFPGNYIGGVSGPDRTPNTFGSFSLKIRTAAQTTPQGPKGEVGPVGPQGPAGLVIGRVPDSIRNYVVYLRTAPYTGKGSNRVTLRRRGKVVASGTIRGRVLRVRLASGVRSIFGRYTIRLSGGSKRETGVVVG